MSVDKAELCGSLLTWLQTFQVPPPCASPQDLSSGLAIAYVLNQIDPSWFNEAWLQGISDDPGPNWRLKVSNLKTILQSLMEYSQDVLAHPVSEEHLPDVNLIGKLSDSAELGKLLQLVLGCAISCEKKQEHIQRIMTLEESVQHVVMEAIQELMTKDPPDSLSTETYGNFDSQSRRYYFLSEEAEEGDELRQRCLDLERQLVLLSEEKQSLAQENMVLREQVGQPEGKGASGLTAKKLLLLQSQLEQLQEENFRLESGREDERLRCAQLEREVTELQQRNQALTSLAQEAQALKDEMDELRQSSERAGQLEATLNSCRRRLGELRELRRQVRQLEERNAGHAERTRQLEDDLRRAGSLRAQLEAQRRQELQSQRQEEAMKAEKWLFECRNLEEKYELVIKEKERLLAERDSLREANEELRCAQLQPRGLTQADPSLDPSSPAVENLAAEILPAELRETLLRLQLENKRLCQQEAADRERQEELQRHLEEANRARHGLETQHRLNQQQLSELRAQVEDLQKALQEQGGKTEDSTLLKRKLEEHLQKLHEADLELQRKREYMEELEPPADSSTRRIEELQHSLQKKDADLRAMEERYRRYVDKARTVIQTLEPKQRPPGGAPPELHTLRTQLQERDVRIRHLEMDFEKSRSQREQEEKLLISAWYNMGMALQQRTGEERAPAHAQSFLAQQRLATNARRGPLGRLASLNLRPTDKH
ncbi:protein Hook homolog 2 isoform X2 [Cynocephalus volans]|uniref:protein Hook homolog 2 isoform X2 n=1 Tax=Cynocephalus volans TaxID=110931 RepID=UPI002FCA9777